VRAVRRDEQRDLAGEERAQSLEELHVI
jgi:hypothetical protein